VRRASASNPQSTSVDQLDACWTSGLGPEPNDNAVQRSDQKQRALAFTSLALVALLAAMPAHAEKRKRGPGPRAASSGQNLPVRDVRAELAAQLAAQVESIGKALVAVGDKLALADDIRVRRLRAAVRMLLHAVPAPGENDRMAIARRRAAAKHLLARDASERAMLADEAEQLATARGRIAAALEALPRLRLPTELARPVAGTLAHRFGTFEHDRSHAQLSRRGVDFEVEDHAPVVAPGDGVVRYAGPMRGLDHGVIVDHGDYDTVIAKLAALTLPVGTRVARGDRLGHAARHRVYLEVRVKLGPGGLPIDPEPLLR
jgi:murein DD-endopeptidase MepM/ murein hydrolase activator NlpD